MTQDIRVGGPVLDDGFDPRDVTWFKLIDDWTQDEQYNTYVPESEYHGDPDCEVRREFRFSTHTHYDWGGKPGRTGEVYHDRVEVVTNVDSLPFDPADPDSYWGDV